VTAFGQAVSICVWLECANSRRSRVVLKTTATKLKRSLRGKFHRHLNDRYVVLRVEDALPKLELDRYRLFVPNINVTLSIC
jgi:hypothetical protein